MPFKSAQCEVEQYTCIYIFIYISFLNYFIFPSSQVPSQDHLKNVKWLRKRPDSMNSKHMNAQH